MEESGMDPNKIKAILPPQISKEFVDELRGKLDFDPEIFVNVAGDKDYFTSSTAYAMHAAREQGFVEKGDIGLIINVGTGIQVAGAFYQF